MHRNWLALFVFAVSLACSRVRDASANNQGTLANLRQGEGAEWQESLDPGFVLNLVLVRGGTFEMGSSLPGEGPPHPVAVQTFLLARDETSVALWNWAAARPVVNIRLRQRLAQEDMPIEAVTWFEAKEFCNRLTAATGRVHRLPSEAEWEYAARERGGTPPTRPGNCGGPRKAKSVGTAVLPNALGLTDMLGNVEEWCEDDLHESYVGSPPTGQAWLSEPFDGHYFRKVLRGGSYAHRLEFCTATSRTSTAPEIAASSIGFRVAVDLQ
jgi:formylglycine-generating enzyme required for sulfatase activity